MTLLKLLRGRLKGVQLKVKCTFSIDSERSQIEAINTCQLELPKKKSLFTQNLAGNKIPRKTLSVHCTLVTFYANGYMCSM